MFSGRVSNFFHTNRPWLMRYAKQHKENQNRTNSGQCFFISVSFVTHYFLLYNYLENGIFKLPIPINDKQIKSLIFLQLYIANKPTRDRTGTENGQIEVFY